MRVTFELTKQQADALLPYVNPTVHPRGIADVAREMCTRVADEPDRFVVVLTGSSRDRLIAEFLATRLPPDQILRFAVDVWAWLRRETAKGAKLIVERPVPVTGEDGQALTAYRWSYLNFTSIGAALNVDETDADPPTQ